MVWSHKILSRSVIWAFVCACLIGSHSAFGKSVKLHWASVESAATYEIEVLQKGKAVVTKKISGNQTEWKHSFSEGTYRYHIRAWDELGEPGLWSDLEKFVIPKDVVAIQKEPSETLNTPTPLFPSGTVLTDGEEGLTFSWDKVKGAKGYEFNLQKDRPEDDERKPAALQPSTVINENHITLPVSAVGPYSWSVRALSTLGPDATEVTYGKKSITHFRLLSDLENTSPLRLQLQSDALHFQSTHRLNSQGFQSHATGNTARLQASVEFYVKNWGAELRVGDSGLNFNGTTSHVLEVQLLARKRFALSRRAHFHLGLGIAKQDFLELSFETSSNPIHQELFSTLGPVANVELAYGLSSHWRTYLDLDYFLPLTVFANAGNRTLATSKNMSNAQAQIGIGYFALSNLQIRLEAGYTNRQVWYQAGTPLTNEIRLDGFMGGLSLKFYADE